MSFRQRPKRGGVHVRVYRVSFSNGAGTTGSRRLAYFLLPPPPLSYTHRKPTNKPTFDFVHSTCRLQRERTLLSCTLVSGYDRNFIILEYNRRVLWISNDYCDPTAECNLTRYTLYTRYRDGVLLYRAVVHVCRPSNNIVFFVLSSVRTNRFRSRTASRSRPNASPPQAQFFARRSTRARRFNTRDFR